MRYAFLLVVPVENHEEAVRVAAEFNKVSESLQLKTGDGETVWQDLPKRGLDKPCMGRRL